MGLLTKIKKRGISRAGITGLTASAAVVGETNAALRPKAPGETKIVALFGITDWNNGIGHELLVRSIFESKKNWRIICVRANKFFTPDLISDADLLITCRDGGADPIDLFADGSGVSDTPVQGTVLWTDSNVKAIIGNVKNRGMGLLALHNSICTENREFVNFLDVKEVTKHEYEPLWVRRLNQNHPITQGIGKFLITHDEQYAVIIKSPTTQTLFETTSVHEKRQAVSGWALQSGKGRIVGLLPGSTVHAYQAPEYQNILWRAAYWAMNRTIEPYPNAKNTLYD
ncbi:MAG: ThuA domain-containing protein [Candidatus Latescibacteria bacterium]|nr:ThuA domain-containing protein [Candidatus Latescibacterota bacterium]